MYTSLPAHVRRGLVGVGCILVVGACSISTNTTAVQCLSEQECLDRGEGFEDTTCSPITKTCVSVLSREGLCSKNEECSARNGAPSICRKSDSRCVLLQTAECPTIFAKPTDLNDDKAVFIGALTPANDSELGAIYEKAIGLAQQDFTNTVNGLPSADGSPGTRPLIVVGCNEFGAGIEGLRRATNHLVLDIKTPLVIGPIDSTNVIQVAPSIFLPNKVASILPTAFISALSDLPNPAAPTPLLWRINISDETLGATSASFLENVLQEKARSMNIAPEGEDIRVLLLTEGNLGGLGLATRIEDKLVFNGKSARENASASPPRYLKIDFGDIRDPTNNPDPNARIAQSLSAAFAFKPHIVIHTTSVGGLSRVFFPLESQWAANTGGAPKPLHIASNQSWIGAALYGFLSAPPNNPPISTPALRSRVFVTATSAGVDDATRAAQQTWLIRFKSVFPEFQAANPPPNTFYLYDSAFLAGLAVAGAGAKPLTGENIAASFARMVGPGPEVRADPADISKGFGALAGGQNIDYVGLSGPVDLDLASGSVQGNAQVMCAAVAPDGKTVSGMQPSGFVWNYRTKQGGGTVTCP